jgi:hypothetical protein
VNETRIRVRFGECYPKRILDNPEYPEIDIEEDQSRKFKDDHCLDFAMAFTDFGVRKFRAAPEMGTYRNKMRYSRISAHILE